MDDEKIMTLHPQKGKAGRNISRAKYELVRQAIEGSLAGGIELSHTDMLRKIEKKLEGKFEGALAWYVETVKLDLEARHVIERKKDGKQLLHKLVRTAG